MLEKHRNPADEAADTCPACGVGAVVDGYGTCAQCLDELPAGSQEPTICACCGSAVLERFCHLPPDPIFKCLDCSALLNEDGSVCADEEVQP